MRRHATRDKGPPEAATQHPIYTTEQLGPNRRLLPNGNLLCMNVPIARAGWLVYGPGEVPVQPGAGGFAYVERTTDALFNAKTVSSFQASAVVNDHPPEDVSPKNWSRYSGGFALNVRRGTGDDADVLLADLMVTRQDLIDDILAGKIEVSAGYDADYEDLGNGAGRQHNLIGNHIALVKKGRCGPRCAIGDQAYQVNPPTQEERATTMATAKTTGRRRATIDEAAKEVLRQRALDAVAELQAAEADEEDDGIHVHIHNGPQEPAATRTTDSATVDRIAALEEGQEAMQETLGEILLALQTGKTVDAAKPDDSDSGKTYDAEDDSDEAKAWRAKMKAKKTGDAALDFDEGSSKALHTAYTELMAQAEVLVPGFKVPTFDAAISRARTVDRMCGARRLCLSQFATADAAGAAMLKGLNGGKDLDVVSMDCAQTAALFKAAASAKGVLNNLAATAGAGAATRDGAPSGGIATGTHKGPPSIAEINKAHADFWKGK